MNTARRMSEILDAMPSFSKTHYCKKDLLPEMMALQDELVSLTFNEVHAENAKLKIWDVEYHLQKLNDERGHVADMQLEKFMAGCKTVCDEIKHHISGNKGEYKVFRSLETVRCKNRILKNIEFTLGGHRTELDGIVLTEKAVYIIEAKNTAKDIVIDARGNYCRVCHDTLVFDKNIGEKMNDKEYLLREALKSAGYENPNIVSLVVFTNSSVTVENQFPYITTCFLASLPHIIDRFVGEKIYTEEDFFRMASAIEQVKTSESYPLPLDVNEFKQTFAELLVALENTGEQKYEETDCEASENNVTNVPEEDPIVPEGKERAKLNIKAIGAVAVAVLACLLVPVVASNSDRLSRK